MGLIIAHGKTDWGKANKHIRPDKELELELKKIPITHTKKVFEELNASKKISEKINYGETHIEKIDNSFNNSPEINETSYQNLTESEINNVDKYVEHEIIPEEEIMFIEDIEDWELKIKLLIN